MIGAAQPYLEPFFKLKERASRRPGHGDNVTPDHDLSIGKVAFKGKSIAR